LAIFECTQPSPPLSAYIETFSLHEGDAPLHPQKERCLPNGQMAIVINLGHDTIQVANHQHANQFQSFYGGCIHGAFSEYSTIDTTTLVTTMSINFKPGGTRPFLHIPATELTNQAVDLSSIFGTDSLDLRAQLQAAQTHDNQIRILERFLLARATWEQQPHPAVMFALASFQTRQHSISEVTTQLGMIPKRFIHLFKEAIGLTPKVYCRVLRFQDMLHLLENNQQVSWTDLALSCGYFDQAHFIHDFQAFSSLTPQAYLAHCSPFRNHVPLP
jgi:AraC-like DNA-binding protein